MRMGYDQHWNFGVQQSLMANTVFELNYVGNKGSHLASTNNFNFPNAGPGDIQSRRPYPRFSNAQFYTSDGASIYHSLQAKVERRLSSGLWYLASYTFSKNIIWQPTPAAGGNTGFERALSGSDIPHNFSLSAGYQLPVGRSRRFMRQAGAVPNALLGGWQMQGVLSVRTGRPFTPTISRDVANNGIGAQRPNRTASGALDNPTVDRWFDTGAFALPPSFTYGNSGGNIIREDGLRSLDCSVFKEFLVREKWKIQFRAESFNLTNTPSFLGPSGVVDTAAGARITATSVNPRQLQAALKFIF